MKKIIMPKSAPGSLIGLGDFSAVCGCLLNRFAGKRKMSPEHRNILLLQ